MNKELEKELQRLKEEKSADLFIVLESGRAVDLLNEASMDERSSNEIVRKIIDNKGWICLPVVQPRNPFEVRILKVEGSNTRKIEGALRGIRGIEAVTTNGAALIPHLG